MQPFFLAWQDGHHREATTVRPWHSRPRLTLEEYHPVIQAQFLGVQFTESGDRSPAWQEVGTTQLSPSASSSLAPVILHQPSPSPIRSGYSTPPRRRERERGQEEQYIPHILVSWTAYGTLSPWAARVACRGGPRLRQRLFIEGRSQAGYLSPNRLANQKVTKPCERPSLRMRLPPKRR